jgi:hypothetical protein
LRTKLDRRQSAASAGNGDASSTESQCREGQQSCGGDAKSEAEEIN